MAKHSNATVENKVIPLALLDAHRKNYNRHSDAQLADLRESLKQFGQVRSIVVQPQGKRFTIVAGHGIAQAAQAEGYTELRADVIPHSWSETRVLAYLAADNELGKHADPDADQLAAIVREVMEAEGEALARLAAGEQSALDAILNAGSALSEAAETAGELVDKAAELQKKWNVARGDVWEIGRHRLMCGDSTSAYDITVLMQTDKRKAELLFSSPPYSDMREYEKNKNLSPDHLAKIFDLFNSFANYFVINLGLQFKNDEVFPYWQSWIDAAQMSGLKILAWNVWDKINATSVRSQIEMFARQHEWVFVFGKTPKELNRTWEKSKESKKREAYYRVNAKGQKVTTRRMADGTVKESTIGETFANKQLGSVFTAYAEMSRSITSHPAMFPVSFPASYIEAITESGDIVIEPFNGSGTTLVACEQTGRIGRGMEIEPKYCAVTLERMSLLGLTPKRLTDGQRISANSEKSAQNGRQTRQKSRVARELETVS